MKRFLYLIPLAALAFSNAQAELGHKFPPLTPDELAKMQAAMPEAKVKPLKPRKLLVFFLTEGYVHGSIPYCNEAVKEMGEKTGAYTADFSEDMGVFTPEKLKQYDAVLFNNTTGLQFVDMAAREALINYVQGGGGVIGIHSATDNFPTWQAGQALMGGKFHSHPWGSGDTEAVKVDDPKNPIVSAFDGKGFWINDEIYQLDAPYDRSQVHVLLSLDMSKPQNARDPKSIVRTDNDFAISWIKQVGKGRVFYCSFGHNPNIFWTPEVLQTYLNGIQYALGDLRANAKPGQTAPATTPALAPETPDPINLRPAKTADATPTEDKAVTMLSGRISPILSMVVSAEITDATPASDDQLAAGLKAVAAYDYGKSREDIVKFDNYIRAQPVEDRAKTEAALLPLLSQPDISTGAKAWICRTLFVIGSDASVPDLQKLTNDPKLSHLAVYGLFCLGTPAARKALVQSLDTVPAPLEPAVIGAVGRLAILEAAPKLARIATLPDQAQVSAAIDALAAIGTPNTLALLIRLKVPPALETEHNWALIHSSFHVLKAYPASPLPKTVFASLVKPGLVSSMRVAAAKGSIEANPSGALTLLSSLVKDDDAKVCMDTAKLAPELPKNDFSSLATALSTFDPVVQVIIVNYCAKSQNPAVEPVLQQAVASTNPDVHLAGIAGYGTANLTTSVAALLPFLGKSSDENRAAIAALDKISEPTSADALKTVLASATGATKAALIAILADRADPSVEATAFTSATDPDTAIGDVAFDALEKVSKPQDLPALLALVPQIKDGAERGHLERAMLNAANGYPNKDQAADLVSGALNGATGDNRHSLLGVLVAIHSQKSVSSLQALLGASSVDDRKDVIRVLASAHWDKTDALLLEAAAKGTDPSEKILALRGYLDSIRAQNLQNDKLIQAYTTAWPLATEQQDKDGIISSLKNMKNPDADHTVQTLTAAATPVKSASN